MRWWHILSWKINISPFFPSALDERKHEKHIYSIFFLDRFLFPNFFVCVFINVWQICKFSLFLIHLNFFLHSRATLCVNFRQSFFFFWRQKMYFFFFEGGKLMRGSRNSLVGVKKDLPTRDRSIFALCTTCFSMYFSCIISWQITFSISKCVTTSFFLNLFLYLFNFFIVSFKKLSKKIIIKGLDKRIFKFFFFFFSQKRLKSSANYSKLKSNFISFLSCEVN